MAVNSNNNSTNSHDSIYFKNYIKSNKKNKIDFKEISLFLGSLCFIGITSFGLFQIITNTPNKDSNKNAANNTLNDSDDIYNEVTNIVSTEAAQSIEATTVNEVYTDIPDTAVEYNGHYYQIFDNTVDSWEAAEEYCRSMEGNLAVINDADENNFLYSYMISQGYESSYFGFTDKEDEGNWVWVDKSNNSYVNWAPGEPNSQNTEENYAMFYFKFTDGTWNDGRWGDDTTSFICEWGGQESITKPVNNGSYTTEISDNDIAATAELTDFYSSVKNVTASSQLKEETIGNITHNYSPSKVIDNDLSTCWCEGKDDYGVGEELIIEFDNTYSLNEITLWNGLCTSKDLYCKNSRVHRIALTFSDGNSFEYEFKDGWDNRKNVIVLSEKIETSSITIKIIDIYEGEKYKDTCISEISVT